MPFNPLDAPIDAPKQYNHTNRLQWYLKHTAACILLLTIVSILVFGIAPLLPKVLDDLLCHAMLVVLMFGLCGITIYTYAKGMEWNILAAIIGGTTTFVIAFVYIMTELSGSSLDYYKGLAHEWFGLNPNDWSELHEFMILGVGYSILMVTCTEVLLLIGFLGKGIGSMFKTKN